MPIILQTQKQYTNFARYAQNHSNQNNTFDESTSSDIINKYHQNMQNLYGPGRMQVIFACNP